MLVTAGDVWKHPKRLCVWTSLLAKLCSWLWQTPNHRRTLWILPAALWTSNELLMGWLNGYMKLGLLKKMNTVYDGASTRPSSASKISQWPSWMSLRWALRNGVYRMSLHCLTHHSKEINTTMSGCKARKLVDAECIQRQTSPLIPPFSSIRLEGRALVCPCHPKMVLRPSRGSLASFQSEAKIVAYR